MAQHVPRKAAALLQASTPQKNAADRPNIHVLAWASDDVSRLRDFWLQQMKLMASCDDGAAYKISFGSLKIVGDLPPQRQKASKGFAFSADHMRAVQGKLAFANSTIAALPLDDIVLYTDLDVMPLQPYSRLLRWLTWNDLVLTHEPQPSITELHRFNGGLWLLRVSRATRALLHNWYATFLRNERLVSGEQAHLPDAVRQTQGLLRIRQFPQVVVLLRSFPWRGGVAETRRCSDRGRYRDCEDLIAGTTVAYHAIALDHDRSLSRLSGERQKIVAMCRAGNMSRGWPVHMGWAARDEELRGVHRQAHVLHALAKSTTSASRRDVCSLYYGTGAGVALRR